MLTIIENFTQFINRKKEKVKNKVTKQFFKLSNVFMQQNIFKMQVKLNGFNLVINVLYLYYVGQQP